MFRIGSLCNILVVIIIFLGFGMFLVIGVGRFLLFSVFRRGFCLVFGFSVVLFLLIRYVRVREVFGEIIFFLFVLDGIGFFDFV